ncbi:hypothetical protein [Burkholderia cenocepacia]|uniref:hypothetical protein n=1 Tax=Burkholderia cenocepacia TaxID=95486 RepID=UPI00075ED3AE|nr:hypothetical protein [Burkholderia cenocepacia]AOK38730.1 hypothetical protein WL90_31210 [Burkholderia cenocepacia]
MLNDSLRHPVQNAPSLDRLRTAAWLQYLLDRLDVACTAALGSGNRTLDSIAKTTVAALDERTRRGSGGAEELGLLAPWFAALLQNDNGTPYEPDARPPTEHERTSIERYFPGSRQVFESAHGVADVYGTTDTRIGVAAMFAAARGVDAFSTLAALPIAAPDTTLERAVAAQAIDDTIGRIWQSDDDTRALDEMAAMVHCAACLSRQAGPPTALYGGKFNGIARAIRHNRPDLASPDGVRVALALCRFDELIGGDSFWVYYLLAGIVIAAPQVVNDMGRCFHGDAWQRWLDALLWQPAMRPRPIRPSTPWPSLHEAMNFLAPVNPVNRTRRTQMDD